MATRGYIGRLNDDGTITTVFSQSNNYPAANGWLLATHYTDPAKVDALIALDSICEIGLDIGDAQDWASAPGSGYPRRLAAVVSVVRPRSWRSAPGCPDG